jgi:glucose/arabinose dehydrogenase
VIRAAALLLLALAACGDAGSQPASKDTAAAAAEDAAKTIPCALGTAAEFKPVCNVEETTADKQLYWIVRHPDGGFRRFQMIDNGTRIATADGADEVAMTRDGGEFIVSVGADRYRFPAAPDVAASSASAQ